MAAIGHKHTLSATSIEQDYRVPKAAKVAKLKNSERPVTEVAHHSESSITWDNPNTAAEYKLRLY